MTWPSRVVNVEQARRAHGDLVERLLPWLLVEDPLADAVVRAPDGQAALHRALVHGPGPDTPDEVRALLAAHDTVPLWVDEDRARRGGRVFFRTGWVGAIVLGARSLVTGYASPAGNKPLAWTGALVHHGERRLAETGRYVAAVCSPGGLLPGRDGWRASLQVRVIHADVRARLHQSGRWRTAEWGAPLNQHDLLATSLLFSQVFIDGVRVMGVRVSNGEAEDHLHLWRWASWLMGVRPELLPDTEQRARQLASLIALTQGPPDEDARRLVQHLLLTHRGPAWSRSLAAGLCYGLLPREQAEALGLERTPWRHAVWASRAMVAPAEWARRFVPAVEEQLVRFGVRHWNEVVRIPPSAAT